MEKSMTSEVYVIFENEVVFGNGKKVVGVCSSYNNALKYAGYGRTIEGPFKVLDAIDTNPMQPFPEYPPYYPSFPNQPSRQPPRQPPSSPFPLSGPCPKSPFGPSYPFGPTTLNIDPLPQNVTPNNSTMFDHTSVVRNWNNNDMSQGYQNN